MSTDKNTEGIEQVAGVGGLQPLTENTKRELIAALNQNWQREVEGMRTYRELAEREKEAGKRNVLLKLAEAEERHAQKWERKLAELGAPTPKEKRTLSGRLKSWTRRQVGTEAALRHMESEEDRDIERYEAQALSINDSEAASMLRDVRREEEGHGRVIREIIKPIGTQGMLDVMLRRERWHKRGGGWLGDAIYGANDGLGSVFGIVSGVAGATGSASHIVLISGLAGMLASALSMGTGAYLASKSEREVYQAEIDRERGEIAEDPEEEKEELSLMYQLKGFSEAEADLLATRLAEQPEQFLRTMAHEELGLSEESFPNPWTSALSAMLSTAVGAFIPIIPFFFSGYLAIIVAAAISLVAHFIVGAGKTLVTGRSWFHSGAEMTIVGAIEAVITYALGVAFSRV